MSTLFVSDIVKVIPCCLATDGTAVKPGLEYDETHHVIVGLNEPIDLDFVKTNPNPNADELKSKIVTEADVTFLTSLDNSISMPVGVHYLPKSMSGAEMGVIFTNSIVEVEICSNCLCESIMQEKYVLTKYTVSEMCYSHCDACWEGKEVCEECVAAGQKFFYPALRACENCIKKGITCKRAAVFILMTDCEEKNKQVMEKFEGIKTCNSLTAQTIMVPDCVHVGKSLKCSWANWFIIIESCRTNLVFIRTLRDYGDSNLKTSLCKLLSLECVRNKDRMAVEPILRLTDTQVIKSLEKVEYVIHTIVPETYKYWKSNLPNAYRSFTCICLGPPGFIYSLDVSASKSRLVEIRLHYPADTRVIKTPDGSVKGSLCYTGRVIYVNDSNSGKILFVDMENKVKL